MKQFISFVRKEFYHIFRDLRTMLILLGMPVVQIILFGFAITTEVKNVKVAVLDFSKDVSTRQIIDKLDASDYFNVNKYQRAFSLSRSARAASIPLSAIFRLRLPFCICLRASPKLRGREVCAATPPMASSTQAAAGKNLRHNRLFISSFGLGVLVSLNKRRWELFSSHLFE